MAITPLCLLQVGLSGNSCCAGVWAVALLHYCSVSEIVPMRLVSDVPRHFPIDDLIVPPRSFGCPFTTWGAHPGGP